MYRKNRTLALTGRSTSGLVVVATAALVFGANAFAQVPVDDNGNPLSDTVSPLDGVDVENPAVRSADDLTSVELETLVGPIALYPDDLLAVVLPASTYPLEIVQAARYLERVQTDSSLEPDEEWDDSVVALLNYPDVLNMMNDDLDWTWQLGDAVVSQQADVILAIESFRDRAYAAGNLKTDDRQTVSRSDEGVIEIEPVQEDVIYVPYYEPERVVYYSPTPVYHYYPRAYPVYYYPYPYDHYFTSNLFWGVTTAFTIGWATEHLHVYHHSYFGHPYYGRPYYYYGSYWRRPSINVYNTWYVDRRSPHYQYRYKRGDYWRPRHHRSGARPSKRLAYEGYDRDRRHDRDNRGRNAQRRSSSDYSFRERGDRREFENRVRRTGTADADRRTAQRDIRRDNTVTAGRQNQARSRGTVRPNGGGKDVIRFRERGNDSRHSAQREQRVVNGSGRSGGRPAAGQTRRAEPNGARARPRELQGRTVDRGRDKARIEHQQRTHRDASRSASSSAARDRTAPRADRRAPRQEAAARTAARSAPTSRPAQVRSRAPRQQSAPQRASREASGRSASRAQAPRKAAREARGRGNNRTSGRNRNRNQ